MANKSSSQPLTLSPQSAQFLLEGVNFFLRNPQEKEWHHLDRASFLFLVQTLTQTPYQKEKEDFSQYLEKVAEFLRGIINKEVTAPSLPANLKELVRALDEFKKTQDAQAFVPQKPSLTIKGWINALEEKAKEAAPSKEETVPSVPPLLDPLNAAIEKELEPYLPDLQKRKEAVLYIAQTVAAHTPEGEISSPPEAVAKKVIIASSPEIAKIFTENHIVLDPQQTKKFFDELTEKIATHLPPLAALPHEKRPPTGTPETPASPSALPLKKGEQISQALKKNPLLLYQSSLPEETSLGEQIEAVFLTRGINPQTAKTVNTLAQKARALYLASQGITASSLEKATQEAKAKQEPFFPLLEALAMEQKAFEEAHPEIPKIFQKITPPRRLPLAPYSPLPPAPAPARPSRLSFFYSFLEKIKTIPSSSLPKTSPQRRTPTFPSSSIQRITSFVSSFFKKTRIYSQIKEKTSRSLARLLSSLKITAKKSVSQAAKKGITKVLSFLSTKLAGTKIGAWLGSIAPGVGNAVGATIGFLFDVGIGFIKGSIRFTNSFLEKLTGGETEAQRELKKRLGPFSFLASPLVVSFITAFFLIFYLVFTNHTRKKTLFVGGSQGIPHFPSLPPQEENGLAEKIVAILSQCGLDKSYINSETIKEVRKCLKKSDLSSSVADALYEYFSRSVTSYKSLQCVGFVQGIEAAQGRTLPTCGDANNFVNCSSINQSSSFQYLKDCSEIKPGTIGVVNRGTYGHIGIISAIVEGPGMSRYRFVSAWGNPGSPDGGNISIIEVPCDYFNALISPK